MKKDPPKGLVALSQESENEIQGGIWFRDNISDTMGQVIKMVGNGCWGENFGHAGGVEMFKETSSGPMRSPPENEKPLRLSRCLRGTGEKTSNERERKLKMAPRQSQAKSASSSGMRTVPRFRSWDGMSSSDARYREVPPHANSADSMQIVLEGGMTIYYPDDGETVVLGAGDCHVVPGGKMHSCVSTLKSLVLVIVGHGANGGEVEVMMAQSRLPPIPTQGEGNLSKDRQESIP